jgi:hypothetical protein
MKPMNSEKIVVYETFADPIKANIVKGLLESYGIECFLTDENIVTLNALYSIAVGGVKLNIFEKDIDKVSSILQSENMPSEVKNLGDEEKSKLVCPNCHSQNVSYGGSVKRKFNFWHVFISFLLMMYPIAMRKTFHCFDCEHEFKKA